MWDLVTIHQTTLRHFLFSARIKIRIVNYFFTGARFVKFKWIKTVKNTQSTKAARKPTKGIWTTHTKKHTNVSCSVLGLNCILIKAIQFYAIVSLMLLYYLICICCCLVFVFRFWLKIILLVSENPSLLKHGTLVLGVSTETESKSPLIVPYCDQINPYRYH